jgi:hypothetical protein
MSYSVLLTSTANEAINRELLSDAFQKSASYLEVKIVTKMGDTDSWVAVASKGCDPLFGNPLYNAIVCVEGDISDIAIEVAEMAMDNRRMVLLLSNRTVHRIDSKEDALWQKATSRDTKN